MTKRSILITGCSSGIGLASARLMRERGWQVFATARTPADLERLKVEELVEAVHLDLTDPQSIAACAASVLNQTGGKVDALFNNAAYGQPGAIEDVSVEALRAQFEVNVFGTHDLTRRIIPAMLDQGHGRIVQCSSILGILTAPYRGAYSASKFALEALSDTMRLELAGTGIDISTIEPGPINTRFIDSCIAAAHRWIDIENSRHQLRYKTMLEALANGGKQTFKLEPEVVAAKLAHAVESRRPKAHYYVSVPTYVAVAARRTLPIKVIDWLAARS